MPENTNITEEAATFIEEVQFTDVPEEALRIGARCVVDGVGLYVAGSDEHTINILVEEALDCGGREDACILGHKKKVPAPMAARVLGTAGHAHDWDDSQVSVDPAHVYGLLIHPTIPSLTAAVVMSQKLNVESGKEFMLAFLAGFEVACKISEWMLPQHYMQGMHSSGTVGHFGAYATTAKLLGLKGDALRHGFGIAASFAAGIRCNFGTMTKPLHVGRAAENGITAALLARRGYTADPKALDGPWGFMAVQGGGASKKKISQGFGKIWTIVEPGVSIKPYPCGVLTHPTLDLMTKLITENNIQPNDIDTVTVYAGSNILKPIRYPIAQNHLQAKFSLPAALSMIALTKQAGKIEFSDEFVASKQMQDMQKRMRTEFDPEIEAKGFDKMRSRITIRLNNGQEISGWADERYRGGPENPLTDEEVESKTRSCCQGVLSEKEQDKLTKMAWGILELDKPGEKLAHAMIPKK